MSFDHLAPFYSWMEWTLAGRKLQRCRTTWLDTLGRCDNLLIAGVGHGHFLAAFAAQFPHARITCVDASVTMLRHARRRADSAGANMARLAFVHAALPEWTPPTNRFDAIVTHFFLDCFAPAELRRVIDVLARSARRDAAWLVSDFSVPTNGFAHLRARAVHAMMYAFFRRCTGIGARAVTPPDDLLHTAGFRLAGRASANWGLLQADRWQRGEGAGSSAVHAAL